MLALVARPRAARARVPDVNADAFRAAVVEELERGARVDEAGQWEQHATTWSMSATTRTLGSPFHRPRTTDLRKILALAAEMKRVIVEKMRLLSSAGRAGD